MVDAELACFKRWLQSLEQGVALKGPSRLGHKPESRTPAYEIGLPLEWDINQRAWRAGKRQLARAVPNSAGYA